MSFTDVGQVLQMQGGTPQLKSGSVFSENLPVTKNITAPTPGSMISMLTTTGLSSIMQSPIQSIVAQITTTLTGMLGVLSSDATPLTLTSLQGFISSVSDIGTSALELGGMQVPAAGAYGEFDLALHYINAYLLGEEPPAALSLATAAGPLTSGTLITAAADDAMAAVESVVAGVTADAAAAATLDASAAALEAVIEASDAAIAGLRQAVPALAAAARIGGVAAAAVASRSSFSSYKDANMEALDALYQQIVQPAAYATLKQAALAACYVAPPTLGPVAPNMPTQNVAMRLFNVVKAIVKNVTLEVR